MHTYKMNLVGFKEYEITHEEQRIGCVVIEDGPMFHYRSDDGNVKGSVPEIEDAVRALRAWSELRRV